MEPEPANKYVVKKEDVFYSLWVLDRAFSKLYCKSLTDTNVNDTYSVALELLTEERGKLLTKYHHLVGSTVEFNREYVEYVGKEVNAGYKRGDI